MGTTVAFSMSFDGGNFEGSRVVVPAIANLHQFGRDLVMPETGGFDLVEKLKASHPGIRIVIITGEIDTLESGDLALKAGVEAIVQMPFQMKELLQAIEG